MRSISQFACWTARNYTNLTFTDSRDVVGTDLQANLSSSLALGYQYQIKEGLFFGAKLGVRNAGANYVYDDFNYNWKMTYVESRLLLGYKYSFEKLSLSFATQGYYGYMIEANQRKHNMSRDMIESGTFDRMDYGLFFSPGVEYGITEKLGLYLNLDYMLGLNNIETDQDQITKNTLMGAAIGLSITL